VTVGLGLDHGGQFNLIGHSSKVEDLLSICLEELHHVLRCEIKPLEKIDSYLILFKRMVNGKQQFVGAKLLVTTKLSRKYSLGLRCRLARPRTPIPSMAARLSIRQSMAGYFLRRDR
jgi:hypothetical protein